MILNIKYYKELATKNIALIWAAVGITIRLMRALFLIWSDAGKKLIAILCDEILSDLCARGIVMPVKVRA